MFEWLTLIRRKQIQVATRQGKTKVLQTSLDFFGNIALQVHAPSWNALTPDARTTLALQHRQRVDAMMRRVAIPERTLHWTSLCAGFGLAVLPGNGLADCAAHAVDIAWLAYGMPLATLALFVPIRFGINWGAKRVLRHLWNANAG